MVYRLTTEINFKYFLKRGFLSKNIKITTIFSLYDHHNLGQLLHCREWCVFNIVGWFLTFLYSRSYLCCIVSYTTGPLSLYFACVLLRLFANGPIYAVLYPILLGPCPYILRVFCYDCLLTVLSLLYCILYYWALVLIFCVCFVTTVC
jgi:hypothetical protein